MTLSGVTIESTTNSQPTGFTPIELVPTFDPYTFSYATSATMPRNANWVKISATKQSANAVWGDGSSTTEGKPFHLFFRSGAEQQTVRPTCEIDGNSAVSTVDLANSQSSGWKYLTITTTLALDGKTTAYTISVRRAT